MAGQIGIICKIESKDQPRAFFSHFFDGGCALLLYAALWGGLCSMAALSGIGAPALALGGLSALALAATADKPGAGRAVLTACAALAAVLLLVRWQTALDGYKVILDRLFAASEARQAYTYEKFFAGVEPESWRSSIQYCLAPAGLLTGLACGAALRFRSKPLTAALFLPYAGAAAYLGVSPATEWSILLAAALALALLERPERGSGAAALLGGVGSLLALALICAGVLAVLPGENAGLSAWDEEARDALALQTAAYADEWELQAEPESQTAGEEKAFYQEEETAGSQGGGTEWLKPLSSVLVILLFALALFLPALLSDLQKRRRAKNRAGLDGPDSGASIRAMFLYTLRWLYLGGLDPANVPFSGYTGQIEAVFSQEIRAGFEAALPLWQEAAYSGHQLGEAERARMRRFMETTTRSVWDGLGRRGRLLAKYIYAL